MPRTVYVNGRYLPYSEAGVHVEDRGFQFADAVYEVIEVRDGALIDETRHLDRLERSLRELDVPRPMSRPALAHVMRECIRRNGVEAGIVYLQVSRGVAQRDFLYHGHPLEPTLVCIARRSDPAKLEALADQGIAVKTLPEMRWSRCDIKTVMLLPAVLGKQEAYEKGAHEAWMIEDGFITEGTSSNAYIVKDGKVITRGLSNEILAGCTRRALFRLAAEHGVEIVERKFTPEEARAADEAFLTSASQFVMPVVEIDAQRIGGGQPGPVVRKLRELFLAEAGA